MPKGPQVKIKSSIICRQTADKDDCNVSGQFSRLIELSESVNPLL